jgi:3-oxoacyl-[acyl-carrier protein] reductase
LLYRFRGRLAQARGAIVNGGSTASFIGVRGHPVYTASKAGVLGFTRTIADMWARHGIRVNMVAAGFIDTQIIGLANEDEAMYQSCLRSIPAGRFDRPL